LAISAADQRIVNQVVAHPRFDLGTSGIGRALFTSIEIRHFPLFQFLLGLANGEVNYRNAANETLFVYSCYFGVVVIVQTIMQAATFHPTDREMTQAMAAVLRTRNDTFIPILANVLHCDWNAPFPPDVNGRRVSGNKSGRRGHQSAEGDSLLDLWGGIPPLIIAARLQSPGLRRALMALRDINVNVRGEYGQTLLFEYTTLRQDRARFASLEDVVSHPRIDLNAQDTNGYTALMKAVADSDWKLIEFLLRKGADVTLRNARGDTAWDIGCRLSGGRRRERPANEREYQRAIVSMAYARDHAIIDGEYDDDSF
jgi:hypothetical protein